MAPQILKFMYINGAIVLLLVAYMLFWRPRRDPSRLKLREPHKTKDISFVRAQEYSSDEQTNPAFSEQTAPGHKVQASREYTHRASLKEQPTAAKTRQLTIYFQFNGHDFESYEVLGLPAGSSFEAVEKTFHELLKTSSADTHEFYRKAFEAIRSQK